MSPAFELRYTSAARCDLLRLYEFLLDQAQTVEDFDAAQQALDAITAAVDVQLSRTPFIFRKIGASAFLRDLLIPFRGTGHVALYEIENASVVGILAPRHQREDDFH